ncbi:MAG: GNAT family N-acetyltransferase [Anaerolineales bacterium]|nr:GNAT family N-acetyltransferase [Anaerolineales bacterium]
MPDLPTKRACVQVLLRSHSPADAIATYYALHHNPARTCLFVHHDTAGRADGFLVRAQTGMDLFTQTVIVRAPSDQAARELFQNGLIIGRPYYVLLPPELETVAARDLDVSSSERLRVYCLEPQHFRPTINALVQPGAGTTGMPRFEIRSEQRTLSTAGVIWRSPDFAEIYVSTVPEARGRGWGRAVVAALANQLLGSGVLPIYVTAENNQRSIRVAEAIGFIDTGTNMVSCSVTLQATH